MGTSQICYFLKVALEFKRKKNQEINKIRKKNLGYAWFENINEIKKILKKSNIFKISQKLKYFKNI